METLKHFINAISSPTSIYILAVSFFILAFVKTRWIVQKKIAGRITLGILAFFIFALFDHHFFHLVTLPDNIPITIMLSTVGFFTWYSIKRGVENDIRLEEGRPLIEQEQSKKTMTWPNLVFIELICMIGILVFLIVWSIGFEAPLEEPGNLSLTPNPSKAPWYFLGLQEMLVYFDPWLAGVVYPGLIVGGLIAIPYIDTNPKGNGYYTFKDRKFAIAMYLFGFLIQWVLLIMLGTFMRGPGWNFFAPFEAWDPHKVEPLINVNLSELIWIKLLGQGLPKNILVREGLGIGLVFAYLFGLPPLLSKTMFKNFFKQMSFLQFNVMCFLFLSLMSLPIKMFLRWTLNLKYLVAIPEYFFNI